ncbi:four helix bundle protein [Chryseobacterium sp. JM1]|uniref:four helix bundle protein n=1 Tax=Chryseobacterium sp. JM1 TaxID=1233950 RepID=UPI0004E61077|nr:four helix bundle protein [Chryseobacterium sp. JM1]KFF22442.1 intervening sequence, 23S rRNA [Chryseobacterium sp. JM1]
MSYLKLDIYTIAFDLFIETHQLSLKLPKYELYELGSQLRRSADSVVTNIAEGYGRKSYKGDFIRFLIYSQASCDETVSHLSKIIRLYPDLIPDLKDKTEQYQLLGGKINNFIKYVQLSWRT